MDFSIFVTMPNVHTILASESITYNASYALVIVASSPWPQIWPRDLSSKRWPWNFLETYKCPWLRPHNPWLYHWECGNAYLQQVL